jgi:hypothetical protein
MICQGQIGSLIIHVKGEPTPPINVTYTDPSGADHKLSVGKDYSKKISAPSLTPGNHTWSVVKSSSFPHCGNFLF